MIPIFDRRETKRNSAIAVLRPAYAVEDVGVDAGADLCPSM
jgi:hypothetical protein